MARRAFCYRFKMCFRATKRCARVIGRLENIYLTFIFDYLIRQTYHKTDLVFRPGLFFQIIREKREKFCREYLGQT